MKTLLPFMFGLAVATVVFLKFTQPPPHPVLADLAVKEAMVGDSYRLQARHSFAERAEHHRKEGNLDYSIAFRIAWWELTRFDEPPSKFSACPKKTSNIKKWLLNSLSHAPVKGYEPELNWNSN